VKFAPLDPVRVEEPLGHGITAFAASEVVFVCTYLVIPARYAARAGFPHDLLETERGETVPVTPPD
jgi:hypothetical protein